LKNKKRKRLSRRVRINKRTRRKLFKKAEK